MNRKLLQLVIGAIKRTFSLWTRSTHEKKGNNLQLFGDGTLTVNTLEKTKLENSNNNNFQPHIYTYRAIDDTICIPYTGSIKKKSNQYQQSINTNDNNLLSNKNNLNTADTNNDINNKINDNSQLIKSKFHFNILKDPLWSRFDPKYDFSSMPPIQGIITRGRITRILNDTKELRKQRRKRKKSRITKKRKRNRI